MICCLACGTGGSDSDGVNDDADADVDADAGLDADADSSGANDGDTGNPTTGNAGTDGGPTGPADPDTTAADEGPGDGTSGADGPTGDPDTGAAPGLGDIFQTVFVDAGCTAGYCHGGAVDELLMTDLETTLANLVDQPSEFARCAETLVVPGQPEQSELWFRVASNTGDCEITEKMPKKTPGLDDETAQLVYDWILAGAMP